MLLLLAKWLPSSRGGGHVGATFDVSIDLAHGYTMLMLASGSGYALLVDLLLERRASVDQQVTNGGSALMAAAYQGRLPVVQRLLRAGADPRLRDDKGSTALQVAEHFGHSECACTIKEHVKAAVQAAVDSAREAAGLAAPTGQAAATGGGVAPHELPREILDAAYNNDKAEIVAWLDSGGHVDATCDTPDGSGRGLTMLMTATSGGHASLLDMLLERSASVDMQNSSGNSALTCAALSDKPDLVRRLLRAGADTRLCSLKGYTALQFAEGEGHDECALAIKEHVKATVQAAVDSAREAAALAAPAGQAAAAVSGTVSHELPDEMVEVAATGDKAVVVAWLDGGGHVDATSTSGNTTLGRGTCGERGVTLLMIASVGGHAPLVEVLLERRATVDLQNSLRNKVA